MEITKLEEMSLPSLINVFNTQIKPNIEASGSTNEELNGNLLIMLLYSNLSA